jgi:hypothetical protein
MSHLFNGVAKGVFTNCSSWMTMEQTLWSSGHLLPEMSSSVAQSLLMSDYQKSKSRHKS